MSWWQDATCRLFCSLLTCRSPWPSSQTSSKALKVEWKILLLFTTAGGPSLATAPIQMVSSSSIAAGQDYQVDHRARGRLAWYPQFPFLLSPDSAPGLCELPRSFWDSIPLLQVLRISFFQLNLFGGQSTWYFSYFCWPSLSMFFFFLFVLTGLLLLLKTSLLVMRTVLGDTPFSILTGSSMPFAFLI